MGADNTFGETHFNPDIKTMTQEQKEKAEELLWDAYTLSRDYNDAPPPIHGEVLEEYEQAIVGAMQKYAKWYAKQKYAEYYISVKADCVAYEEPPIRKCND